MEIWLYHRECQIGDYVYCDATTSNILNKTKTIVGVCFYVDPNNKSHRLCVALKSLASGQFGLFPNDWPGGISLNDNPGYTVFDIPTLTNKNISGLTENYITLTSYRDTSSSGDADGFKIPAAGTYMAELGWVECDINYKDYKIGNILPWGLINTIKIVQHCERVLNDSSIQLPLPTKTATQNKLENLYTLMQRVIDSNSSQAKYREYYYPMASECNAYEPGVAEEENLAECFQEGHWFLPSIGELARLYWWYTHDKYNEPVAKGIFGNMIQNGIFTDIENGYRLSSTEQAERSMVALSFSSGNFGDWGDKSNLNNPRPIAAF